MILTLTVVALMLCAALLGFVACAFAVGRNKPELQMGCSTCTAQLLEAISGMREQIMSKLDEFNTKLEAIDTATNEIAADLQALRDLIANSGGLSAADADAVLGMLDSRIARLTELGAQ